ncbi:MAG: transposase [Cyclobacteriaceae bacterium]
MATKTEHSPKYSLYFCTFTCYKWLKLFEEANAYMMVYDWFKYLKNKKNVVVIAFVIMPNHCHLILHLADPLLSLNKLVANGKRFMAYGIIERLKKASKNNLLKILRMGVSEVDKSKKQKHRVFEPSFDAKPIYSEKFLEQKIDYIHQNPVRGKWNLVDDYSKYQHSSAAFYEMNQSNGYFDIVHYKDLDEI